MFDRVFEKQWKCSRAVGFPLIEGGCLVVVAAILVAGLWPFHAPVNQVSWATAGNGISFLEHGVALGQQISSLSRAKHGDCTLELLIVPTSDRADGTIVSFDSSRDARWPFSFRQHQSVLAVRRFEVDVNGKERRPVLWAEEVFQGNKPKFIALVSEPEQTILYVDGVPKEHSRIGFVCSDLAGRLVVGNSTVDDGWSGTVRGLAIFEGSREASQIRRDFEEWNTASSVDEHESSLRALYLFNEHGGTVVHDEVRSASELTIPSKYVVLHPWLLQPIWQEHRFPPRTWTRWADWEDIALNVLGFVPVGFFFLAYWQFVRQRPMPLATVVVAGFAISLGIEVGQWFLPTRNSGMLDLVTNTIGTLLGAVFCRYSARMVEFC